MRRFAVIPVVVLSLVAGAGGNPLHDPVREHAHKESAAGLNSNHVPGERLSDVGCEDGMADVFPCDGVDLLAFVPYDEFVGLEPSISPGISDLWGWTDEDTGDEYVIIGKSNGVAFFRVTDPTDPVYLGDLPNTAPVQLIWHDIKVFDNHAFMVSESNPYGMRVFDLTRLRGVEEAQVWTEDMRYPLTSAAHNIAVNEDTGFAYIVGGNAGIFVPDHCLSGLHMIDISTPLLPLFAGCYTDPDAGGGPGGLATYVHDTQCVVYDGPHEEYVGRELCFNSNEVSVTIADVTDKSNPEQVGVLRYPQTAYTHQGWLTEDHRFFLFGDELDEQQFNLNTRTLVVDVTDLENPTLFAEYFADTRAIDHNLYIHHGLVYQSNYAAGLRVLDTAPLYDEELEEHNLEEIAFFDTFPPHDNPQFVGTWSNYPFFESGTIAVSGIDEGLFLLRLQPEVAERARPPVEDGDEPA